MLAIFNRYTKKENGEIAVLKNTTHKGKKSYMYKSSNTLEFWKDLTICAV